MFRFKKYKKGWVVERKDYHWTLFGISYKWVAITNYAGTDEPYHYKTPEEAMEGALDELRKEMYFNFHF